eukprot:scaffold6123_cov113-Isochrysis_galbana.AAC.11
MGSSPRPHASSSGDPVMNAAPSSITGLSQLKSGSAPAPAEAAASQCQMRTRLAPIDARSWPSDEKATCETGSPCGSDARALPEPKSHRRTVSSSEADAATSARGAMATSVTGPVCPRSSRTHPLDETSHSRSVPSCEAETA